MSDLLLIEFASKANTEEIPRILLNMQKEYLVEPGDVVTATKCGAAQVKLNQLYQPVKAEAISGLFWGSLIGLLFMMSLIGAVVGAASGAPSGSFTVVGISDELMREAGKILRSGDAALCLLIHKMTTDEVTPLCKALEGVQTADYRDAVWASHKGEVTSDRLADASPVFPV
jgi:uncharacterized membrane protein